MRSDSIIGYIDRISAKEERHFGLLRPLGVIQLPSGTGLALSLRELKDSFPNRGYVTWLDPPPSAIVGSIWEFRIAEQHTFQIDNPHHDLYKVASAPAAAYEVIDVGHIKSPEDAQAFFASSGLRLVYTPSDRVLLHLDANTYLGPVRLVSNQDSLLTVEVIRNGQPVQPFAIHSLQPDRLLQLKHDGIDRTFVSAAAALGPPLGQVDWSPDDVLLKRVLRLAKDASADTFSELTHKLIESFSRLLEETGSPLEHQRIQRALRIIDNAEVIRRVLPSVMSELLQTPQVAHLLAEEKEKARTETVAGLAREFENQTSHLQTLQLRSEELRRAIEELEKRQQDEVTSYEERQKSLEEGYRARCKELLENPGKLVADASLLRSMLGYPQQPSPQVPARTPGVAPPFVPPPEWKETSVRSSAITTLYEIKKSAQSHRGNVSSDTMRRVIASLAAGLFPIVTGPLALKSLMAAGDTIAGGRSLVVPVSPNYTDPLDVFGRIDRGRLVLAPGALASLVVHACKSQELFLVILDGVNRAPTESYLLPIIRCYCATQDQQPASLSLMGPNLLAQSDPYQALRWFVWPKNVLLAGTAVRGPSVLPVTAEILEFGTFVYSSASESETATARKATDPTSVVPDKWVHVFDPTSDVVSRSTSGQPRRSTDESIEDNGVRKLRSALARWSADNSISTDQDLLEIHLLPSAIALDKTEDLLKALGKQGFKEQEMRAVQQAMTPFLTWK